MGVGAVILVVDDEPPVLRLIERVLKAAGYCVYTAHSAGAAMALAEMLRAELDVLICDIFLGQASGLEVSAAIHAICPHVKHILISGEFTPESTKTPLVANGITYTCVPKPYTAKELISVITRLTD